MSTSGPGLFDDDLAGDVRDTYRRLLQDRVPDDEATRRMIEDWADLAPDEKPVFWLALAATQFSLGRLGEGVRRKALEVIDTGQDLDLWRRCRDEWVATRASVLAALRVQLTGPQPARKAVRRPWRYVTDLSPGMALARRRVDGEVTVLRVVATPQDSFTGSVSPVLQRLAWSARDIPRPDQLDSLPFGPSIVAQGWDVQADRRSVCSAYRWRKRDPDWADIGFVVCGSVGPRDGDDRDWELLTPRMPWENLAHHLDLDRG